VGISAPSSTLRPRFLSEEGTPSESSCSSKAEWVSHFLVAILRLAAHADVSRPYFPPAFGCIYIVNEWLVLKGPVAFFGTIAGTGVGLSVLALPMYVYGKRLRRWTSESRALGWMTR
jgi:hypothetical protein